MTPRAAIIGQTSSVLLDLDLRGTVLRFTTAPAELTVTDRLGVSYVYAPGLQVGDISRELGAPLEQIGITISREANPGWAKLRARGYRLGMGSATLRQHYGSQTLEQAEVLIRGSLTAPSYGDEYEPFSAGVERRLRDGGMIPGEQHRIDDTTWPVQAPDYVIDEASVGQVYPIPIGYPGRVEGGDVDAPTTPAFLVEWGVGVAGRLTSQAIIALGEVDADYVTLHNISHPPHDGTGLEDPSVPGPFTRPVVTGVDLLGEVVSTIDWNDVTLPMAKRETDYRIAWDQGGGVLNRERTGPLRGAGEVIRWLLEEWTTLRVDSGRMEAQRELLDAYKLDFCIASRCNVWDLVRSRIAPLLPVDWRESENGGYFQARKLDADRTQVTAVLIATPNDEAANCVRTSALQSAGDRIFNRVTVLYAPGGQQGAYLRSVTVDAEASTTDPRIQGSMLAKVSQTLLKTYDDDGIRDLQISADLVFDESTARRIARDAILQYAVPRESVSVQGGTELDYLDLGDVVSLTDSSIYLTSEVAIVQAKTTGESFVALSLLLLNDPVRSLRVTT